MGNLMSSILVNIGSALLEQAGDEMSARITKSNRQVFKLSKDNGRTKYSATRYPSTGAIVETKSTKK